MNPAPFTPELSTSCHFRFGDGDVWSLDLDEAERLARLLCHTSGDERPADWEPSGEDYLEAGRVIARSAADLEAERFPSVQVRINKGAEERVFVVERKRMVLLVRASEGAWEAECFADYAAWDFAQRVFALRADF